ncbi:MAG: LAGLIDADG family homing endonuclease [Alphaproteobacteria bacterium]
MPTVAPISQQIWDMKYRLRGGDGKAVDNTIEDSWARVAGALAAAEEQPETWKQPFFQALSDFQFLPAGRILAGAGAGRNVTLFNCFVMGTIPDDMSGIFENLREAALTMQQGGGIGYDFSTLRPNGARVEGVGADASGPLTFMDVWDAMCRTIMSAGHRRGAMMATLRCDHPDIEAFIKAKQNPGRLRMFNLSVLVTDAFMGAVKNDAPWELQFNGRTYSSVRARDLWDSIMRATYAYAEPGVIFIDRINQRNNLQYCEEINSTNPCVTGDTWIATDEGPRQVNDLLGRQFRAMVNGQPYPSTEAGFFPTGNKQVFRIAVKGGHALRLTANHLVRTATKVTRYKVDWTWRACGDLKPGDQIAIHDHRAHTHWPGAGNQDEGYLIGLLIGDGTLKTDKAVISVWPGQEVVNGTFERPGTLAVMDRALNAARSLPHRADFTGWMAVPGRGEYRMSLAAVKNLAHDLGLAPGNKAITPAIENRSSEFYKGLLCGLFDADGSIQGTQQKGVSVRLAQSDLDILRAVQRMLQRLGIVSTIYPERRPAGKRLLPDGKGGRREYECKTDHELSIANENVGRFAALISFTDGEKSGRLATLVSGYKRTPNRERFIVKIDSIEPDSTAPVFDVQIPGINAFDANGIVVHNCGEQPLPPYGACLLGSINLAKLVQRPFAPDAALDLDALRDLVTTAIRMLDNAIDVSRFPLPQQADEARAKRRIGLGVTGLADALIFCRARYGSDGAVSLVQTWMAVIRRAAYLASVELAKEKGAFPLFEREAYLAGESIMELDGDVRAAIAEHGIRNALLTSIAPTGTISIFADNVSSGLEPVFAFTYRRHVTMPDGSRREEAVSDYAYRRFRAEFGEAAQLPDYFATAAALTPSDHVRMQAAVQTYIDASISKTINLPEDISFEAFKDVYMQAYDTGCKGCTTYRPNEVTGAVLETEEAPKPLLPIEPELPLEPPEARPRDELDGGGVVYMTQPLARPGALQGRTYKINWPESDHGIYITINDIVQDARVRPFEVFINSKNVEHFAWTVALTRMISAVFRRGGDVSFVVEELKAVFDPRGGHWVDGRYIPSLLAAIGEVIERHMIAIGFIANPNADPEAEVLAIAVPASGGQETTPLRGCPKCGTPGLIRQEGCETCVSCGYSKCS